MLESDRVREAVFYDIVSWAVKQINVYGHDFGNTREYLGLSLTFDITDEDHGLRLDLSLAENALKTNYYGPERYQRRLESELLHYKQIEYSLLHKVEELAYFHGAPLETRKNVIFSNDCISLVQYLKRGPDTRLEVFMRSSDVKELLPMDLLYLAKALRSVNTYYTRLNRRVKYDGPVKKETLYVRIGSAHYYTSGGRQ